MGFREDATYRYNENIFNNYKKEFHELQLGFFNGREVLLLGQNPGQPFGSATQQTSVVLDKPNFKSFEFAYEELIRSSKIGEFIKMLYTDWQNISFTNIVKVPTDHNELPSKKLINTFLPITMQQITMLEPKLVVCFGRFVGQFFGLHFFYESRCIINEYYHTHYLMIPHPSYLMRSNLQEIEVPHIINAIGRELERRENEIQQHRKR